MNENFYKGLAGELAAKLGRVSSFVKHGPSIGAFHEEVLKAVLRPMLPDRFSFRTGFVYNPEKGPSQQGDILIVDEFHPEAYFFREGNFAVVHEAALVCVIEVKTRLSKKDFIDGVNCLASYQNVTNRHPATMLFAFSSGAFTRSRLDAWYKATKVSDEFGNYPWLIFALNHGVIQLRGTPITDKEWGHYVCLGETVKGSKMKNLSWFLQSIKGTVFLHSDRKSGANPFSHAICDGLFWSKYFFRFGSGLNESTSGG